MDYNTLLLSANGRLNRQPYWMVVLVLAVVNVVVSLVAAQLNAAIVGTLVSLLLLFPNIMVGIKRCHDRDRSGWFLLIGLIPVIGGIWLLVELGFLRGTEGPNRFGPDPLSPTAIAYSPGL